MTSTTTAPARWRYDVELTHHTVLRRAMEHRGYSVRGLAKKAGCGESVVAHMRTGRRKTCSPTVAREIEKLLDVVPGTLFVSRIRTVHAVAVPVPAARTARRR